MDEVGRAPVPMMVYLLAWACVLDLTKRIKCLCLLPHTTLNPGRAGERNC